MKNIKLRNFLIVLILCFALLFTSCDFLETAVENAVEGAVEGAIEGAVDGAVSGLTGANNSEEEQDGEGFLGGLFNSGEEESNENNDEDGFLNSILESLGLIDSSNNDNDTIYESDEQDDEAPPTAGNDNENDTQTSTDNSANESQDGEDDEEIQAAPITVNENFKAAVLGDNATIKQIHSNFAGEVEAELFMGGTPIIYYYSSSQSLLTYYQFVIDGTDMYEIWSNSSSTNDRGLPNYNLFPDHFTVDFMYHASPTMFKDVFPNAPDEIAQSRNISDLNAYLGTEQEAEYIPGESNAVMTTYDKYIYTYHYDGLTIIASGGQEGVVDSFIMYEIGNEPDYLIY